MKIESINRKILLYQEKLNKINNKQEPNFLDEYNKSKVDRKLRYYQGLLYIYQNEEKEYIKKQIALLKERIKREEILYGNLVRTILMVCLPIAVYVFFNSFYNLVDSVMCASISASSVSDVAILAQIKNAINAFGSGLAGGGAVLVSRYYGAGKLKEAKNTAGNMLMISVIMSILICLIMIPIAPVICKFSGCTGDQTAMYFSLQMAELAIVAINTIFIGLEKVKGNSKRILLLNVLVLIIKLTLNAIFIYVIQVDSIVWIEVSSIIAQSTLFIYGIRKIFSKKNALQIKPKYMKLKKLFVVPILKLSIPVFLGKFVMNVGKYIVNLMSNIMYSSVTDGLIVGALSVSNNMCGLITSPTNAFEEGESTIVSQNIGNKNVDRTISTFIRTSIIVMTISIIGYILVRFVFLDNLVNLFVSTKITDPNELEKSQKLVKYIKEVFVYDSLSIPTLGVTACVLGLLYGYGKTFLASILNFSRIGTRILSLLILYNTGIGYEATGIAMGISNSIIMILSIVCLIIFFSKFKYEKMNILNRV